MKELFKMFQKPSSIQDFVWRPSTFRIRRTSRSFPPASSGQARCIGRRPSIGFRPGRDVGREAYRTRDEQARELPTIMSPPKEKRRRHAHDEGPADDQGNNTVSSMLQEACSVSQRPYRRFKHDRLDDKSSERRRE